MPLRRRLPVSVLFILVLPILRAEDPPAPATTVHECVILTSVFAPDGNPRSGLRAENPDLPEFVVPRSTAWGPVRYGVRDTLDAEDLRTAPVTQSFDAWCAWIGAESPTGVKVKARLPNGLWTRWCPSAESSPKVPAKAKGLPGGVLDWGLLQVSPAAANPGMQGRVPKAPLGSAWASARAASRSYLETSRGASRMTDQFLFARGVADFPGPLGAAVTETLEVSLTNRGDQPLPRAWVLWVPPSELGGRFPADPFQASALAQPVAALAAGEQRTVPFEGVTPGRPIDLAQTLAAEIEKALVESGLLPAEARAALRFGREAWFFTPGVRVLYLIPRAFADRTLPLEIQPAPREHVRVWIGCAEVLDPDRERAIEETLAAYLDSLQTDPYAMLEQYRLKLLREGRFLEPILRSIAATTENAPVAGLAKKIAGALANPSVEEAPLLGPDSVVLPDADALALRSDPARRRERIAALTTWIERWHAYAEKTKCDATGVADARIELRLLQWLEEKQADGTAGAGGPSGDDLAIPDSLRMLPLRPSTCGCTRARETGEMPRE